MNADEDPPEETARLYAITVDALGTDDADRATTALRDLWERVEDPVMLREAVNDAGGTWVGLLPMFDQPGGGT